MKKILIKLSFIIICCCFFQSCVDKSGVDTAEKSKNDCVISSSNKKFPFEIHYNCNLVKGLICISEGGEWYQKEMKKYSDIGKLDPSSKHIGMYRQYILPKDTSEILEFTFVPQEGDTFGTINSIINLNVDDVKSFYKEFIYFSDTIFTDNNRNQVGLYKYLRKVDDKYRYFMRKSLVSSQHILSISFQIEGLSRALINSKIQKFDSLIGSVSGQPQYK